jgi:hypothetical protein
VAHRHSREAAIEDWVSKGEIAESLGVHSRGVDRADANLLAVAYHGDAAVDYGFFKGPASELATILAQAQKGQPVTMHRTCNMWIKVQGEKARSESYVFAYAEHSIESGAVQRFIGGRYLDRHERREGAWRLSHRLYVMDFNMNRPSTARWPDPPPDLAHFGPRGGHAAADAGRTLLAQFRATFASQGDGSVTAQQDDSRLDVALSKQALHELNMAYARAADRADMALMASIFHEDATVVTGLVNGRASDYAAKITSFVRENLERCFHSIANEWYEVHGDRAVGECYVIAHVTAGGKDMLTGGRYIDAYERRDGVWKISARTFVLDWTHEQPTSDEGGGLYASLTTRGCFGKDDPIYAFWDNAFLSDA